MAEIARPIPRGRPGLAGPGRLLRILVGAWVGLVLVAAVFAAFGWLDLLREAGGPGGGPRVPDALPLRRLAGGAAQPLGSVVLAFAGTGLVAGLALIRLSRPTRAGVLLVGSGVLLALASELVYAIQESESLDRVISTRRPGGGVLVEALLLGLAATIPPERRRRGRARPGRPNGS